MLEQYNENEKNEMVEIKNREIVEEFLRHKKELSEVELKIWNIDMIAFYKQRKRQIMGMEGNNPIEENDVYTDESGIAHSMVSDELKGLDKGVLGN